MKKILIVINNLKVGGAERLVVDDINEMLRQGIEVRLLTFIPEKSGNSLASECNIAAENWQMVYFKGFLDVQSWFLFIRLMRRYKPDVVVSHLWYANTLSRIVSKICGAKNHFAFEHNIYDSVKTKKMFVIDRILQSFSTKIIAVSEAVMRSLIRHGINPKRIVVLYNAIDTSKYVNISGEELRKELNPKNEFAYIFIGRLIEQKGVDILLEAFAKLDAGLLLIVGDGRDKEKLKKLADRLEIRQRACFLGIRPDIPNLLSMADCFILPSRYEGLGVVLIEAIVSGKAIIISDFEAGKELIKNEENGLIVPKENPQALAEAMWRIQQDKNLKKKLEVNVKQNFEKHSIKYHVDTLLRIANG